MVRSPASPASPVGSGAGVLMGALSLLAPRAGAAPDGEPPGAPSLSTTRIVLQDETPLAFLLVTPSGAAARVRSSVLIDLVSDLFERHTDLSIQLVASETTEDCRGRLPCIVRAVRTDYDREALLGPDGRVLPFAVHVARLRDEGRRPVEFLFLLSSIALEDGDRLVPQWVDTHRALAIAHEAEQGLPEWDRDVEARVRAEAVRVLLESGTVRSEAEASAFLTDLVTTRLRPLLERRGHWEPFGEVVLSSSPEGAAVTLDGRIVGTTRGGEARILRIRPGRHRLELSRPDAEAPWQQDFAIGRGERVVFEPALRRRVRLGDARAVLAWTGVGVGLAGVGLGVWALAAAPGGRTTYCSEPCQDRFFALGEEDPGSAFRAPEGGGVLAAPLGYGLLVTGVAWTAGSLLLGDLEELPWLPLLGGLALGGLAYGVSAALDGGAP